MVNSEGVKELKLISALKKIMSKVSRWVNTIPAPPKRSGTRQRCPLPSLLLNTVMEELARSIRQEIAIKSIRVSNKQTKNKK